MKTIIFSFAIIFYSFSSQAQISLPAFICKKTPLAYNRSINCPASVPSVALHKIFEKSFPDIIYKKTTQDNGEVDSVFGTKDYAYYLKTTKDNKIISLEQGLASSDCHYVYKIEKANGSRYCNAVTPKEYGVSCIKKHTRDPIVNPKNHRVNCDAFLEAMLSCGKDSKSTESCIKDFYVYMDKKDTGKPIPNPYNKPLPESEHGIADSIDEGDFVGEPDTIPRPPVKTNNSRGSR